MDKPERIALWAAVALLTLWLLVLTVMTAGELAELNRVLRSGQVSAPAATEPTIPWWGAGTEPLTAPPSSGPQVGIAGVQILSDTLTMTVTVRSSGAGDLLYEPPVLADESGLVYQVYADSLEEARLAFLDLVTRGQAEATLEFAGAPADGARLLLIFNPSQQPGDILAPHVEVPVPVIAVTVPEPTPEATPEG